VGDVGQTAAGLNAGTQRRVVGPALSGVDEFDLNARMRCREQIDLLLEVRQPSPDQELHRLLRPHYGGQGRNREPSARGFQEVTTLHRPPKRIENLRH